MISNNEFMNSNFMNNKFINNKLLNTLPNESNKYSNYKQNYQTDSVYSGGSRYSGNSKYAEKRDNLMLNKLSKNNYLIGGNTEKPNLNKIPDDRELQEHQLREDMLKFTDDNPDFVEFKQTIKTWLELDDDIKTLRKAVSERNKQKKELTPKILEYMQKNKIYNLNTESGRIKCRTSVRTKSFNNSTLKEKLISYFQNVNEGTKAAEYLLKNKEKVENITLSRVKYRKKSNNEINI